MFYHLFLQEETAPPVKNTTKQNQDFRKAWWLATALSACVGVCIPLNAQNSAPATDADITEANPAETVSARSSISFVAVSIDAV